MRILYNLKTILIILAILFVLGVAAYVGISWFIANKFLQPKHLTFTQKSSAIGPGAQDFEVNTTDNINLKGWFFKNNATCAVVLVPGIHQNRISGDYGGQGIAQLALEKGYGVIMYDPRGSGFSGGNTLGFGATEVRDVNAVLKYLTDSGYASKNIAVIGSSLGGITTLQDLDITKDLGAVIVDSAATAIKPIIEREMVKEKIPTFMNPGIFLASKLLYGVDIGSVRPIDKVKEYSSKPILFIHGVKDVFIPFQNSEELLKASSPQSKLVAFADADHVQSFKTDPELFEKEVFSFLSAQMPQCSN